MKDAFPLVSVLTTLKDKFMEKGFLASLGDVTEAVRKVWKPVDHIPMTMGFLAKQVVGSQETRTVGFWQPGWQREFTKELEIVVFCRTRLRFGTVEVLSVQEAWKKDDDGRRVGEMVQIICQRKDDVIGGFLDVATGTNTKYLKPAVFSMKYQQVNPVLNPWATDEELFEYWGIEPGQRASLAKVLAECVAEYCRQYQAQQKQPLSFGDVATSVGCSVDQLKGLIGHRQ